VTGGLEPGRATHPDVALPTPSVLPGGPEPGYDPVPFRPGPLEPAELAGTPGVPHDPPPPAATGPSGGTEPAPAGPARYRDALASRELRGLLVAQVVSECGDYLARVALALLVLARSDSAFLAALTFAVSFFPALVGGSLLASLADRLPRRGLMVVCDLARVVVVGLLALLAVDSTPIWLLLALLFVAELFASPFMSAQRALIADVLPDPRVYLAGNSLQRVLFQVDQVLGLLLAGLVVRALGSRWSLAVDAMTFAFSALVLLVAVRRRPAPMAEAGHASRGLFSDFTDGWRAVFDDPARRILVLLAWGGAIVIIGPEAVALAYARADGAGATVGGALLASLPAGAAVGSYLVMRLEPHRQLRAIVPLFTVACLPLLATCWAPPWWVALPLWFASGLCQAYMIPLIGTVTLLTAADLRGRVNALAGAGFSVATALAFLFAGAMADLTSPAVAVTIAGVSGLVVVGLVHLAWPKGAIRRAGVQAYGPDVG
jgi:MFS family permease